MATEATEPKITLGTARPGEEYVGYKTGIPALDCAISCLERGRTMTSALPHFGEILNSLSEQEFGKFVERAIIHLITTDEEANANQADYWLNQDLTRLRIAIGEAFEGERKSDPDQRLFQLLFASSLAARLAGRRDNNPKERQRLLNMAGRDLNPAQHEAAKHPGFTGELGRIIYEVKLNTMSPVRAESLKKPFVFARSEVIAHQVA